MDHNSHIENPEGSILIAIIGYASSFIGQIMVFGLEVGKAAILGFVGAAAGLFARWLYRKYVSEK